MRIHLICAAFPPFGKGGGPVSSELIARGLAACGHEVEVLTVSEQPYEDGTGQYRVRSLGSPNVYANIWRQNPTWKKLVWHLLENFNPLAFVRVRRRIKQFRPDLVMTVSIENVNVATWVAAKSVGLPVVHVIHSYFVLCWRGAMYHGRRNCEGYCLSCRTTSLGKRLAARCVDAIVGESSFVNAVHLRHSVFTKAVQYVVPSPIDRVDPAAAAVVPRRKSRLTVGYIGNISPGKGILTLARAASRLCRDHGDNIQFRVAGTGDEDFLAEVKAQFPARITEFVGWTSASGFYRSVDVVVVPSIFREAFGRASVEPLAYGVPVVVARSGGLPENVEQGVSGLVFTADDDEELARLLAGLARDEGRLQALSAGALARAGRYDFSGFCSELDRVVSEVQRRSLAGGVYADRPRGLRSAH